MKSNKKVFLLKNSTLSSKNFLNFRNDTTTVFKKNNYSFWLLKNIIHTNIAPDIAFCKKRKNSIIIPYEYKETITNSKLTTNVIEKNLKFYYTFFYDNYFSSASTTSRSSDWYFPKLSKSLELIFLNLKDVAQVEKYRKNIKEKDIFKFELITNKRDTSSIGNTKNVNYFNDIPNVLKENTYMGEDIFINFNSNINNNRGILFC